MTIAAAVEELQGHQLSQEMQTSIVQSLREGFLKAPPSWAA
jgi:hypothetical protein